MSVHVYYYTIIRYGYDRQLLQLQLEIFSRHFRSPYTCVVYVFEIIRCICKARMSQTRHNQTHIKSSSTYIRFNTLSSFVWITRNKRVIAYAYLTVIWIKPIYRILLYSMFMLKTSQLHRGSRTTMVGLKP